jgi:hypothetical protein
MIHIALYFAAALVLVLIVMFIGLGKSRNQEHPIVHENVKSIQTIKWFLQTLPEPHRKICLQYMNPKLADTYVTSLKQALGTFCIWEETPHEKYFCELFLAIRFCKNLPDPPKHFT